MRRRSKIHAVLKFNGTPTSQIACNGSKRLLSGYQWSTIPKDVTCKHCRAAIRRGVQESLELY